MNIYYVYAYINKKGLPYYIGKGKNNRAWNKNHCVSTPKDESKIIIMEYNLTEIGAIALERRYINWYGRKNNGTGILRNLTDGGEGHSGYKKSKETRRKLSKSLTGRKFKKINNPSNRKGVKLSEETKQKLSLSHKNKKHSEESNIKRSKSLLGRISPMKGKIHSPKTIILMKESQQKRRELEEKKKHG